MKFVTVQNRTVLMRTPGSVRVSDVSVLFIPVIIMWNGFFVCSQLTADIMHFKACDWTLNFPDGKELNMTKTEYDKSFALFGCFNVFSFFLLDCL